MVSKTDNDFALVLYRCYRTLQARLAGDEKDLDRRFDKIIADIDRQKRRTFLKRAGELQCVARMRSAMRCARTSPLGQVSIGGAAAGLVAKLAQYAQGWAGVAVAMAIGALTAGAVVAIIDIRGLKRSGRSRHRREEAAPTPHP
ncbi:hypothetical protein [Streptomyces avermitilis]|uniref:hypothetical protein n=1 Tax=Streptomyces avermitilis TaxID=33903 RepID=UPI0038064447